MIARKRLTMALVGVVAAVSLSACGPAMSTQVDPAKGFYDPETGVKVTRHCDGPNMVYVGENVATSGVGMAVVGNDPRCKG